MIIIGILLNIVGLGIFCWALFNLAVYAFPFVVGMTAGIHSLQAGTGPFSAIFVGFIAGGFTLLIGQCAFSVTRSWLFRLVIGLQFAVPAASAGYGATLTSPTSVLLRNAGLRHSPWLVPSSSEARPGRAC